MPLKPHYMFLNYTTECNSRCTTCRLWAGPQFTLPTDQFRRIGRFVSPDNLREIYFTGGEPLLPDNAVDMAIACHEWKPGVAVTGATNSLDPESYLAKVEAIKAAGVWLNIMVSCNGLPETHDKSRGTYGNYGKTIEMAAGLKEMGCLTAFNLLEMPTTTEEDRQHARGVAARFGVPLWFSPLLRSMPWFGLADDGQIVPHIPACHGGTGVICIRPTGDITACQEPRPYLTFCNLRDDELSEERIEQVQAIVKSYACQPCGCCTPAISRGIRCVTAE